MTAPSSPPDDGYRFEHRPDVQGMRAFAVILVVLYHAEVLFSGGFVGVDVFFVISGFVITGSIMRSLTSERGFSLYGFYSRRALRLLPSLSVLTCATLAMSLLFSSYSALEHVRGTGVAATLFNANHYLMLNPGGYFGYRTEFNALLHTWSLSVEEQFYFVFPLALLLMVRRGRGEARRMMRLGLFGMSALAIASFAGSVWTLAQTGTSGDPIEAKLAFFLMPLRAWEFIAGVLIALALPALRRVRGPWWMGTLIRWVGVGMIVWCAVTYDDTTTFPGLAAAWPVLGSAMMILAGSLGPAPRESVLATPVLVRIGDLSYGWYLWHWPLIVFVRSNWVFDPVAPMVASLFVSLALAWANERLIEERFRRAKEIAATPKAFVAFMLVCLGAPVVFSSAHDVVSMDLDEHENMKAFVGSMAGYHKLGCNNTLVDWDAETCHWSAEKPSWRAMLVGDSTARQFIPAVSQAVPALGGEVVAATLNSCAISNLTMRVNGTEEEGCTTWRTYVFDEIARARPDVLIVSSAYDRYVGVSRWTFQSADGAQVFTTPEQKAAALDASVLEVYRRFADLGITVVFVRPVPKFTLHHQNDREIFDSNAFLDFSYFSLSRFANPEILERPSLVDGQPRWSDTELGRLANASALEDGAHELDVTDEACPDGVCAMRRDGVFVYIDAIHLSPDFVATLAPLFEDTLRPLVPKNDPPSAGPTP